MLRGGLNLSILRGYFPAGPHPPLGSQPPHPMPPQALSMLLTKDWSGTSPLSDIWAICPLEGRTSGRGAQSARRGFLQSSPHTLVLPSWLSHPRSNPSQLLEAKPSQADYGWLLHSWSGHWSSLDKPEPSSHSRLSEVDLSFHLWEELQAWPGLLKPLQPLTLQV